MPTTRVRHDPLTTGWISRRRLLWGLAAALVAVAAWYFLGAWRSARDLVIVKGLVTVVDEALPRGVVIFHSNNAKGNLSAEEPRGEINKSGEYELKTGSQRGAPPGWYKVSVVALEPRRSVKGIHPPPVVMIDRKYGNPATSGLEVEVKHAAGSESYNIVLAKKAKK
jgi:hypothetical protein